MIDITLPKKHAEVLVSLINRARLHQYSDGEMELQIELKDEMELVTLFRVVESIRNSTSAGKDYYGPEDKPVRVPFVQVRPIHELEPPTTTVGSTGEGGYPEWVSLSMPLGNSRMIVDVEPPERATS